MAKFPIYEQQTVPGAVRASGQDFGAGVAEATGQMGGVVADIGIRMKRREDVIERVQLASEFDRWAQDSLTALNDTGDIGTKATVDQYTNGLREKAAEIVKRHGGGGGSRAELQAQIENQAAQYAKSATAAQVKAQQTMIGNTVDQKANELAISAGFAPDKINDAFAELDHSIDMMADAMSPTLAAQYKEAGRSRIAQGAISKLLTDENYTAAKAVMNNPEVGKYLDPNAARSFSINIAVDEGKAAAEVQRVERNVASWTQKLGRNLSPEEVQKVRSLPEKKDMTVSDKIVEFELVTGKPATQDQIDKFYGVDGASGGASGMFGNSLQGRALSFVADNSVAYANGMLSPEQARFFEMSVTEAYKPFDRKNELNGQIERVTPTIPNFVRQATEQGSRAYGGGSLVNRGASGSLMPGQTVQYTDPSGRVVGQAVVDTNGNFSIKDTGTPQQQGANSGGGTQPPPQGNKTIWEMSGDMAGPIPAAKAALGDVPYLGSVMEGGGETASNRSYIKTQVSQMVDALSINPRNPVALVEMIRKEIDIDPKVMGDPAAYRKRIEGVARALTERLIEETAAGGDPSLPIKTRQDALDVANTIRNFQKKLMPPMVKNRAELDALGLESGSKFIDPNGVLRQVP
jgi:hypothetical protein